MKYQAGEAVTYRGRQERMTILAVHERQGVYELSNGLMASDDRLSRYIERQRPLWRSKPVLVNRWAR